MNRFSEHLPGISRLLFCLGLVLLITFGARFFDERPSPQQIAINDVVKKTSVNVPLAWQDERGWVDVAVAHPDNGKVKLTLCLHNRSIWVDLEPAVAEALAKDLEGK